jgi:hypothetical protein
MSYPFLRNLARITFLLLVLNLSHESLFAAPAADSISVATVRTLVSQGNVSALKNLGTSVLPVMVELYRTANESGRANLAAAFYGLGWKSPEAKRALTPDVHTANQALRIQHQRALLSRPRPLPAVDLSDFGIQPRDIQSLKDAGLWDALQQTLEGQPVPVPQGASAEHRRLFEVAALWVDGTAALNSGKAAIALERFESAYRLAPGGKIYELNAILSLAALNAWQQVDTRLLGIYADWVNDIRFPAAIAMIGIARKNLAQAEEWLHVPPKWSRMCWDSNCWTA